MKQRRLDPQTQDLSDEASRPDPGLGVPEPESVSGSTLISIPTRDPRNQLNDLTGREWIQATKSVWFQKGLGASHPHAQIEREHPAPFSFQDVQRLIEFFTKHDEAVLDPFSGVASTLKAAALAGRTGVGVELSERWAESGRRRLEIELPADQAHAGQRQKVLVGDSRQVLAGLADESFGFVVTSPPYWGILNKPADHKVRGQRVNAGLAQNYSDSPLDLANIESYSGFLTELGVVFAECHRLLRPGRYMAIVVGDFRHKQTYIPYHADIIRLLTEQLAVERRFDLNGITILVQNAKGLYPYGYPFSYVPNVHHQYVLIFRKPKAASSGSHRRLAANPDTNGRPKKTKRQGIPARPLGAQPG